MFICDPNLPLGVVVNRLKAGHGRNRKVIEEMPRGPVTALFHKVIGRGDLHP